MSGVSPELTLAIAIVPVVSTLAGYWFAGRNDEKRDKRATEREERARVDARAERLDDERQAFQREVLLELQDRLLPVTRTTTEIIMRDRRTLKESGQIYLIGDELSTRNREAGVALIRLRERVLNDDLRRELQALHEFATQVELLSLQLQNVAPEQAIRQLDNASLELGQRHIRVNEILGRELRAVLGPTS